jgi:peptidoglycan-N-acetylglucosamine deacetylase
MSRTSKFLIFLLVSAVLSKATWNLSKSETYQVFGEIIPRVQTEEKIVALTFDDGPTQPALDELLPKLRERGVKATFFLTGAELKRRPDLGRKLVEEGHELGNHSYFHKRMAFKTASFISEELRKTDELIRAAGYNGTIHFRPPYGTKLLVLPYVLEKEHRKTITWDIEPDSYKDVAASSSGIVNHVVPRVKPGSIIILHVMYPSRITSREAVPDIIDELHSKGFRFVTVSELLKSHNGI